MTNETSNEADGVRAVQAEVAAMSVAKELEAVLPAIHARIETAAEASSAAAQVAVEASDEDRIFRTVAPALKIVWNKFETSVSATRAKSHLSESGKRDEVAQAEASLDADTAKIQAVVEDHANRLRSKFPEPSWRSPTADEVGEIQILIQSFQHRSRPEFLRSGIDVVRRASDPNVPVTIRARLNQLLVHAYAPLVARTAEAPERHARALAPVAEKLSKAIALHLDTVLGKSAHQAANDRTTRVLSDFNFAISRSKQAGNFDDFLVGIGAASIFPRKN